MARFRTPTPEEEQNYRQWLSQRPAEVRAILSKYDPWTHYLHKPTGLKVMVLGCNLPPNAPHLATLDLAINGIAADDVVPIREEPAPTTDIVIPKIG